MLRLRLAVFIRAWRRGVAFSAFAGATVLLVGISVSVVAAPLTAPSSVGASPSSAPARTASAFRHATVEAAWKTASAAKRPLVVMFTSDNCPHCERMLADVYAHPSIQRFLLTNSESVLADRAANRQLVAKLGIRAFPTTLVVSGEGKIVDAVEGYLEPAAFAQRLSPWLIPRPAALAERSAF